MVEGYLLLHLFCPEIFATGKPRNTEATKAANFSAVGAAYFDALSGELENLSEYFLQRFRPGRDRIFVVALRFWFQLVEPFDEQKVNAGAEAE